MKLSLYWAGVLVCNILLQVVISLVPRPSPHVWERGSGGLAWISCHWHLSHLECEMSNQIAEHTIKIVRHWSAKWPPWLAFRVCKFCAKERTLWVSALFFLRTELQTTYLQTSSGGLWVCVKDVAGFFSSSLTTEIRNFAAPFTSDWSLMEGSVADYLKVRLHNKSSSK